MDVSSYGVIPKEKGLADAWRLVTGFRNIY